ncbi:MAG: NAD-dependent epimerase/dehydratase family protein [Halobacteriovoraceae bacterium]|jgi:UDP-glucose 4-epimerase|nr:NAD-dependent epimerase/dehydratase family protein [Halobacteriovoraceae bacterium]MBT5093321.1 NAD-dependent epimerase/dehydratase family protein [Halobacteriovoraceae bacterium]
MIGFKNIKSVLIIGAAGGLAEITASLLIKEHPEVRITGIDPRPIPHPIRHENIEYLKMRFTRTKFEKLFREKQFDLVLHLARMSHADSSTHGKMEKRLDANVIGTKRILDLCLKYEVKKVIILSTYHVYGALNDNPTFITEDFPLRASIRYPELRDVVEMDQLCTNWMWKNQSDIETLVLRPCAIIGPQIQNTMTRYLTTPYAPLPADFNPMFQYIHEFDMAKILIDCIAKVPTGLYNIAPDEAISVREARNFMGLPSIPIPMAILYGAAKIISSPLWRFPDYLLDYLKYSCIIDNNEIKKHIGNSAFRFSIHESLELLKLE